jgi:hypothetical protein
MERLGPVEARHELLAGVCPLEAAQIVVRHWRDHQAADHRAGPERSRHDGSDRLPRLQCGLRLPFAAARARADDTKLSLWHQARARRHTAIGGRKSALTYVTLTGSWFAGTTPGCDPAQGQRVTSSEHATRGM